MGLQNGTRITAELRRSQVLQLKQAGASEQAIADQLGVSKTQINNDVKRRLAEIRRSDTEAVEQEYTLQKSRYERLLLRWWSQATGPDDTQAARATGIVLDILRRIDSIGGLVPDKPLIQLNQDNRQIIQSESIRIDIADISEALTVLRDAGAIRLEPNGHQLNGALDGVYTAPSDS
jgi:hypothetical protein